MQQKAEKELNVNCGYSDNYGPPSFLLGLHMRLLIMVHHEDNECTKDTSKAYLPPEFRLHLRNPCQGSILQHSAASYLKLQM